MSIEKLGTAQITSEEGWANFEKERKAVERALFDVTMYSFDYRIELMNELLGDVFEKTVPRRTPVDPQFKTLIELATCEAVKEESERRDRLETSTT
jgi:hypothetical protein